MKMPWTPKLEQRADSSYTDALIAAITANSRGEQTAFPTATGALEMAAGFVGRAFQSAEVMGPAHVVDALGPAQMGLIGRSLIRRGELVLYIQVSGGRVTLLPCQSHDIDGGARSRDVGIPLQPRRAGAHHHL